MDGDCLGVLSGRDVVSLSSAESDDNILSRVTSSDHPGGDGFGRVWSGTVFGDAPPADGCFRGEGEGMIDRNHGNQVPRKPFRGVTSNVGSSSFRVS